MNTRQLLALPWMALSKDTRSVAVAITLLAAFGAALACVLTHKPGTVWLTDATHGIAVLDCFFWAGVLSQPLLLAREAYRLRMPALGRAVPASLAVYALLTIVLPALGLAWLAHDDSAGPLVQLSLGAGLGMAYATLPPYLGMFVCFVPMLDEHLARWLPMPAAAPDRFLVWAAPCAGLLWLLIARFWRVAVRRDYGLEGMRRPILLNLRNGLWYGRNANSINMESRLIGQRARWLQPTADLRGCGPGHAMRSLRVALGGLALPLTPASRVRQTGIALASMLFFGLLIALPSMDDGSTANPLSGFGGLDMLTFYLGMVGALLALIQVKTLERRWRRANAELPLLALLPGLGGPTQVRRSLLGASLLPALLMQAGLLVAILLLATHLQLGSRAVVMLVLGQLTGMGMLVCLGLAVLGHTGVSGFWKGALMIYGLLLVNFTSMLVMPLFSPHALATGVISTIIFAVLWASFLTPLLLLGRHGWRGLQRRPHPFMPTL